MDRVLMVPGSSLAKMAIRSLPKNTLKFTKTIISLLGSKMCQITLLSVQVVAPFSIKTVSIPKLWIFSRLIHSKLGLLLLSKLN